MSRRNYSSNNGSRNGGYNNGGNNGYRRSQNNGSNNGGSKGGWFPSFGSNNNNKSSNLLPSNEQYSQQINKLLVQKQISVQEVVTVQTFLRGIDNLFKMMNNFAQLVEKRDTLNCDDDHLLTMNEILIQSLNAFGVTCNNNKKKKKMLMVGISQYEMNVNKMSEKVKKSSAKYCQCIESVLHGKEMDLYPLIHKTAQQKEKEINEKTINDGYSYMIGGSCTINKFQKEVKKNYQKYDKHHEQMYKQQQKKKNPNKTRQIINKQQPSANDLINVPGRKNIKFAQNHIDDDDDNDDFKMNEGQPGCDHDHAANDKHQHPQKNKSNTYLVKEIKFNNGVILNIGFPVHIVKDEGAKKVVKFASPNQNVPELPVPNNYLCDVNDITKIQDAERIHIMENGALGSYESLLGYEEEQKLIQQHRGSMQAIFAN